MAFDATTGTSAAAPTPSFGGGAWRRIPQLLPWLACALPVCLFAMHAKSPLMAVEFWQVTMAVLGRGLLWTLIAAFVLLLGFPPFPAYLRLWFSRAAARLTTDRGPFVRALTELRNLETAARHLEAGRAALACGDPRVAIPHLARALELDKEMLPARYQLGLALLEVSALPQARAVLHSVVLVDPGHAFGGALLTLARCAQLAGDRDAAVALFEQHAHAHGGNRKSHFWLGQARLGRGDRSGARAAFEVAAARNGRLSPEEGFYRARARVALWRLPQGSTTEPAR